jgi:outer membrane protein OmpA-like peptidoglycan-associated protein
MKRKLSCSLFALIVILNLKVSILHGQLNASESNYVVIGAFSVPKNAIEFTEEARKHQLPAEYSINPLRNLFYVYVLQTPSRQVAIEEAKKLRQRPPYLDAWVFSGLLGENQPKGNDGKPIVGKDIVEIEEVQDQPPVVDNNPLQPKEKEKVPDTVATKLRPAAQTNEVELGTKKIRFIITTQADGAEIQGDIDVMDWDKASPKKVASYRSNEPINMRLMNTSGNVSFDCEVFGYRKISLKANLKNIAAVEGATVNGEEILIPFQLDRLKKGDNQIMYNVYFYNDAAIMRPESKNEINALLSMMRKNPNYKIRIHGHTNGNQRGKIISMGASQNFFALTGDIKNSVGSAKKLSEERAKVVRQYLINQGIEPNRLEIKAWGGSRPIYDKNHAKAYSNLRVEIEIIEE